MNFTKEQRDILKQHEDRLYTASKLDYARGLSKQAANDLLSVFKEATGKDEKVNFNCSHCVLAFLKRIGKMYYDDLAEIEKASKMVEVLDEVMADVPDEPVSKEPEPKPAKKTQAKKSTKKATKKTTKK